MGFFKALYESLQDHSDVYQLKCFVEEGIPSGCEEDNQYLNELRGKNGGLCEYSICQDGNTMYLYHGLRYGKSMIFLYPGENVSSMINDIDNFIDMWNRPSIKLQWPYFYKAYENGKQELINKISVRKISHFDDSSYKFWVIGIDFGKEIEDFSLWKYENIVGKLFEAADKIATEIIEDNGRLRPEEQLKTMGRGCSRFYTANELYKKFFE